MEEKENELLELLGGLTLCRVQPEWDDNPVPHVFLGFKRDHVFKVHVLEGVHFQGCMVNTLRKAQPVADVVISKIGPRTFVQLWAQDFPLLSLLANNTNRPSQDFPFVIEEVAK